MNREHILTALVVAFFVGSLLNVINSYDVIIHGTFNTQSIIKIVLTYITPFCVSLYSGYRAMKQRDGVGSAK